MNPDWRKGAGIALILLFITLYAFLIALFAPRISTLPVLAQALLYLVLGVGWAFPLKPLIRWMRG